MSCQQCHRSSPIQNGKTPDTGFAEGKIAMMIDGEWQVSPNTLSHEGLQVNYGVAPFPPPAAHSDRANAAVVRGPVVIVPAGALDKKAAVQLLAWMMSPEIVTETAYAHSFLPTSRTAAEDPQFQQMPDLDVFMNLMEHPNAEPADATPIGPELNEALGQVEAELLYKGRDLVPLLDEAQGKLGARLKVALSYYDKP